MSARSYRLHIPKGFAFSSASAGIKASGRPDLALAWASSGTTAAALFTRNRVSAAPVQVGRQSIAASRGKVRAVIVNSGNANCATGPVGLSDCRKICQQLADLFGIQTHEVFPSSTGIIGVPLPAQQILNQLPQLAASARSDQKALLGFARSIMTTDLRPKLASQRCRTNKTHFTITGVAKGSGMIHPNLATMLVYIFTDIRGTSADIKRILRDACAQSFNCISVDGDTSTNDTVLLLASGQSDVSVNQVQSSKCFRAALLSVCKSLAEQIVRDGEGVRHRIRLHVGEAKNVSAADRVARAVARSLLVKTAWAGADPNWGRILAAIGNSGVDIAPEKVRIRIGNQLVCRGGWFVNFNRGQAHAHLSRPLCEIRISLGQGRASTQFLTGDLTQEYVRINADYST